MATQQTRIVGKLAVAPSVVALFLWMIVPLGMTIWFSLLRYNLLDPGNESLRRAAQLPVFPHRSRPSSPRSAIR